MQVADISKVVGSVSEMTQAKSTLILSAGKIILTGDPAGEAAFAATRASKPETTTDDDK